MPMLPACHSSALTPASSEAGLSIRIPRARYDATMSSPGSRTLAPAERWNSRDATSARSTGAISVSCLR